MDSLKKRSSFQFAAKAKLPLDCDNNAEVICFSASLADASDVMVVKLGIKNWQKKDFVPWVRLHSSCKTGDIMGSLRCDCREQLAESKEIIAKEGGYIIYLDDEGRGIGFANKIRAYHLQDQGADTYKANEMLNLPADSRDYGVAKEILHLLKVKELRLLTNNPNKLNFLQEDGFKITREPLIIKPNQFNKFYLERKQEIGGHFLTEKKAIS